MIKTDVGVKIDKSLDTNKSDVPFQMLYDSTHIEIFGRNKLCFEGRYKIVEYSNDTIKIKNKKSGIIFNGNGLSIGNIQKNSFVISGMFSSVVFE